MIQAQHSVRLYSEMGRLNAVLLHKPGPEIEAMTPQNAGDALYSDILNKKIVDEEYRLFQGVLGKCAHTYQVQDILAQLLENQDIARELVVKSCQMDNCPELAETLLSQSPAQMAKALIEGAAWPTSDPRYAEERYQLKPLYNLFFTRDAASCVHDRVLINTMSFSVRSRESLIYKTIFENFFHAPTFSAQDFDTQAHTEGGDVQIVRNDLLCVGCGIRTDNAGIESLMKAHAHQPNFTIIAQQLPKYPESFIHLDMVFTFLGPHACMAYEPLLKKTGNFEGKQTTVITSDNGKLSYREYPNILEALRSKGVDLEPVICGGNDSWMQQREQWHSGANFFALGENHILGYRRNTNTIDALDKAGFQVLTAEEVVEKNVDPFSYEKCVVTFAASELPRGGGGARCMTCPINRNEVDYQ